MKKFIVFLIIFIVSISVQIPVSASQTQNINQRIQRLKSIRKSSSDPVQKANLTKRIQNLKKRKRKLKLKQSKNTSSDPAGTTTSVGNILRNLTTQIASPVGRSSFSKFKPSSSGDFGLTNLRLDSSASFTSFDDATLGTSGQTEEYSLSLSGDLTESDTLYFTLSNSRFRTAGEDGILATTNGFSSSWIHSLNDNFGIGAFGVLNSVDIEEFNGNSYSYAYGLLFTSFNSFEHFEISTATALAHSDYESGYDQLLMASVTLSKSWTDNLNTYISLAFTDSFKSDPDSDPTFGSWTVGCNYLINDHLSVGAAFQRTEFLNNFSDNTLMVNIGWSF